MNKRKRQNILKIASVLAVLLVLLGLILPFLGDGGRADRLDTVPAAPESSDADVADAPSALTDVAPAQPHVDARRRDRDSMPVNTANQQDYDSWEEMTADSDQRDPSQPPEVIPPDEMDIHDPPLWTKPIAQPDANPTPPDPTKPPPIAVDPRRIPKDDAKQQGGEAAKTKKKDGDQ